ncbi:MAG: hypothetical protein LRY73_09385 [Bacillus sp. (in: Bacteria)]|nr:hypothetical protein [Bacillus sp. (in: firmicutes)]
MKQGKAWLPISIAIVLIGAASFYVFYIKPSEFLSEEALIEVITSHNYGAKSIEIQDVIYVGEKHVFVPFKTHSRYGTSYWVWRGGSWDLGAISNIQSPRVWKVNPQDPSSYVIVWNMDPNDDMTDFELVLSNRRNYWVSDNVHHYTPRVQLHHTVAFQSEASSYGVMSLPEDWLIFLDDYLKVENAKQPSSSFIFDFFPQSSVSFAWMPYDKNGEVTFPGPDNGSGSGYGNIHLEYMSTIPEHELE